MSESILVTGAHGCVGAWTVRELAARGNAVFALDLNPGWGRMEQILPPDLRGQVTLLQADITDLSALRELFLRHRPQRIVHLAALLGPACRDNPILAAQVDVVGTVNLFEMAIENGLSAFVYASTVAVFGSPAIYPPGPLPDDARHAPTNHYGAFKAADELIARAYWEDRGFGSVGLRPGVVYGPGRDTGTTADPMIALQQVCRGKPGLIRFTGPMDLQYAPDVARVFADCVLRNTQGSLVYNLRGTVVTVEEYVKIVTAILPEVKGLISFEGKSLPWPAEMTGSGLERFLGGLPITPLQEGLQQTIEHFRNKTHRTSS